MTDLLDLPLTDIDPHPDNPRLQLREDVVERLVAEIGRSEFGREHAVLVRPYGGRYQLVSGHHRIEAARRLGLVTVPAWARDMEDDEAFMQLVLCNNQGELTPLEYGVHALRAIKPAQGKAGGGVSAYAAEIGYGEDSVRQWRKAAEVYGALPEKFREVFEAKHQHLYEFSKAPRELWEVLADRAHRGEWTGADSAHYVRSVRDFDVPAEWAWWLNPTVVAKRYLDTKEFSPQTVKRLIDAATQVHGWIDSNARDVNNARESFHVWLGELTESDWQPRIIAGYLQRLIAAQFVVEGWHQGDWRAHLDKLDDGTVTLLLTDPPYGMGYQSDYRLDRRKDLKHETIAADSSPEAASDELLEALQAFWPKLADDAHVLVFCGWGTEPTMREIVEKAGYTLRGSLVWDKQATGMGDPTTTFAPAHERILHAVKGSPPLYHRAADLLSHRRCDSTRHPTEKPETLLTELIEATTVEGQIVADPFGGVASTPAAAKAAGRRWFGCELSEQYWATGEERLLS